MKMHAALLCRWAAFGNRRVEGGQSRRFFAGWLFTLAGCLFLVGCGGSDKPNQPASGAMPATAKGFKEQLTKFKMQRDKLRLAISRLEERKRAAVERLENMGVHSKADMAKHPDSRIHIREIQNVAADMKPLQRQTDSYDSAIARLEAKLRELDRQAVVQTAQLSKADLNELSGTILDLNEQLKLGAGLREDLEAESVVEQELGWK